MYCKVPRNCGGRRCEVKVTIRIEQDKYHFVKRSFKSLEEAERYIFMAKVAKTKNDLKNLLR